MMRGYSWFHVDPWEKNGYLKGSAFNPGDKILHRSLDMLQNRFRLFSYEEKHMVRFLKKLQKASYLEGYSSMIYELAKMARKHGMEKTFHLKLIKGTSEQIFNSYQILAKEVFNSKIISEYGAVEAGIIGFECPQGNMHINMEQVIAEEENHEIVITNLHSFSFPIIRYKLGDYVELSEGYCDCGMKHPLIKNVRGRVGKIIYGKDETYPSITIPFIFENLQLHHNLSLHYQLIQHHKGHLTIKIEQNLDQHTSNLIEKEMVRHFGRDMDFEFETNVPILTDRGKMKTFISTIE
jgi:phenylacetate-CoA ligase